MKLQGLPVDRSTLAFWVGVAAAERKPVYLRMKEILLGSAKIALRLVPASGDRIGVSKCHSIGEKDDPAHRSAREHVGELLLSPPNEHFREAPTLTPVPWGARINRNE